MNQAIADAIQAATAYLLSCQAADGHWEDYRLPVGRSDAWVTGYVGVALAESADCTGSHGGYLNAASWLENNRPYLVGWGYNRHTGPDADSTAFALRLLLLAGKNRRQADMAWLRQRWQRDGGFATYENNDAWGDPHSDITPAVFMALSEADQAELRESLLDFLNRRRQSDGTWPSYWWRTSHYATYWSLLVLRRQGWTPEGAAPVVHNDEVHAVHSVFDLALVTGIASLQCAAPALTQKLSNKLIEQQRSDGAWPGGANLRVTEPNCHQPWEAARGRLYTDIDHLITTATALRVLSEIAMELNQAKDGF